MLAFHGQVCLAVQRVSHSKMIASRGTLTHLVPDDDDGRRGPRTCIVRGELTSSRKPLRGIGRIGRL